MSTRRRIFIFLAIIIGLVLIVMLITRLGNPKKSPSKPAPVVKPLKLADYSSRDSKVILIIDGRLNGDDVHRAIRISVSRGQRQLEVIQGYQGYVIKSYSFDNNLDAYKQFINALDYSGFAKEKTATIKDPAGMCPNGNRYVYELLDNNDQKMYRWGASCSGMGNSGGNHPNILSLFKKQITDYDNLVRNVEL